MTQSIVIVGAGLCGARAAFGLRDGGFQGHITLIGSEVHAPYDRPPLSKQTLHSEPGLKHIADADSYLTSTIDHLAGVEVIDIDREGHKVALSDGRTLAYDKLLLATGASPRMLTGSIGLKNVLTLRTHDDAVAIRDRIGPGRKLIIVGGGFIGLEVAATARQVGTGVTVVEGLPRLMARAVPSEIAAVVEERHRQEGVEILLNAGVSSISETNVGIRMQLSDGQELIGDFAVIGIGAVPNIALAEKSSLRIENGIAVDDFLATSDPDIFAAGDCCSFPLSVYGGARVRLESWRCAQDQGVLVAANMLGERRPFGGVPWFWSDQYDLTLQIAGLPGMATSIVRRDLGDDAFLLFHLDKDGRLVAASGVGRGNVVGRDIKLAEMLIAARAHPKADDLATPSIRLKTLLAA